MPDRMPIIEKIIQLFTDKLAICYFRNFTHAWACVKKTPTKMNQFLAFVDA